MERRILHNAQEFISIMINDDIKSLKKSQITKESYNGDRKM